MTTTFDSARILVGLAPISRYPYDTALRFRRQVAADAEAVRAAADRQWGDTDKMRRERLAAHRGVSEVDLRVGPIGGAA